ncbi:circularly permuted YqeH GTPase [Aspergillus terreus]|uniref:Circularly permuted YqeH GTPase n=1 Tax=Aspergillus terreus TaxID=33178 RepID=A0A5M3Z168_ASPTE|nr:hypothetical protein ATETN484_0005053100 [Aspergillus terreus]GFF17196.1 circularly permuted YqeH GTPase [Aspergillus terreus]
MNAPSHIKSPELVESVLPICCPGCGAYAQTVEPNEPGYYSKTRKQTRKLLSETKQVVHGEKNGLDEGNDLKAKGKEAANTIQQVIKESEISAAPKPRHGAALESAAETASQYLEKSRPPAQVCDRCHDLIHHNRAVPAVSPSIYSIREYLDESPYKHNRIYHLIDAADFPMSLVDNIYEALAIQEQRSRNRRASTEKYRGGRKLPTITFVITRSDLLAPTKEQVDSKMEYMRSILREKLAQSDEDFRLGNVHMISAHRGWWTKKVKEEIRDHGGGVWVVGKANVGKSSFIEACFPKDSKNLEKIAELVERREEESVVANQQHALDLNSDGLLPPAPREDLYPVLPVVSSLPGTTVSPIRIPFGRSKGEMIDLPGLDRGELVDYVRDEYRRDVIMTKRKKPERYTIKPGQSLLLGGGLVRITPTHPDDVVTAACFLPIEAHITKTEKAVEMQAQTRIYPGENIMKDGTGELIMSAGTFDLKWDVTSSHLPRSIAKAVEDRGVKPPPLPYRVMSTDILIEGCGWVELTVQIRAKSTNPADGETPRSLPQVEVFAPNGRHIAARRPIECWNFIADKMAADQRKKGRRGRQNIGQKKRVRQSLNA